MHSTHHCVVWMTVLCILGAAACEEAAKRLVRGCVADEECATGICYNERCAFTCTSSDECAEDEVCVSIGDVSVCVTEDEVSLVDCTDASDCFFLVPGTCQQAVCSGGNCGLVEVPDGESCDDGDLCNGLEVCQGGECMAGTPVRCPAASDPECKTAVCDPATGSCEEEARRDGTPCLVHCHEGSTCQDGECVAGKFSCACQSDEDCEQPNNRCEAAMVCIANQCMPDPAGGVVCPPLLGRDAQCQVNQCNPASRACEAVAANEGAECEDNLFCTVDERCQGGECVGSETDCSAVADQCNVGVCNEKNNRCEKQADADREGEGCDDGRYCTEAEKCTGGFCTGGTARDCALSPLHDCKIGWCDEAKDECTVLVVNEGGWCDDGLYCTHNEFCHGGECQGGVEPSCSRVADQCNDGTCSEDFDSCVKVPKPDTPEPTPCNDGDYCTVDDECHIGRCRGGGSRDCSLVGDQCNDGVCDEDADDCVKAPKTDGTGCDDGQYCTIADNCQAGACTGGGAIDCSQVADDCNDGVCDEATDTCVQQAANEGEDCDDGQYCTVGDQCTNGACGGTARDCTEADDVCNVGQCDEVRDRCAQVPRPNGTTCDADSNLCTVGDQCLAGECTAGLPKDCSAFDVLCGHMECDRATGECTVEVRDTPPPDCCRAPTGTPEEEEQELADQECKQSPCVRRVCNLDTNTCEYTPLTLESDNGGPPLGALAWDTLSCGLVGDATCDTCPVVNNWQQLCYIEVSEASPDGPHWRIVDYLPVTQSEPLSPVNPTPPLLAFDTPASRWMECAPGQRRVKGVLTSVPVVLPGWIKDLKNGERYGPRIHFDYFVPSIFAFAVWDLLPIIGEYMGPTPFAGDRGLGVGPVPTFYGPKARFEASLVQLVPDPGAPGGKRKEVLYVLDLIQMARWQWNWDEWNPEEPPIWVAGDGMWVHFATPPLPFSGLEFELVLTLEARCPYAHTQGFFLDNFAITVPCRCTQENEQGEPKDVCEQVDAHHPVSGEAIECVRQHCDTDIRQCVLDPSQPNTCLTWGLEGEPICLVDGQYEGFCADRLGSDCPCSCYCSMYGPASEQCDACVAHAREQSIEEVYLSGLADCKLCQPSRTRYATVVEDNACWLPVPDLVALLALMDPEAPGMETGGPFVGRLCVGAGKSWLQTWGELFDLPVEDAPMPDRIVVCDPDTDQLHWTVTDCYGYLPLTKELDSLYLTDLYPQPITDECFQCDYDWLAQSRSLPYFEPMSFVTPGSCFVNRWSGNVGEPLDNELNCVDQNTEGVNWKDCTHDLTDGWTCEATELPCAVCDNNGTVPDLPGWSVPTKDQCYVPICENGPRTCVEQFSWHYRRRFPEEMGEVPLQCVFCDPYHRVDDYSWTLFSSDFDDGTLEGFYPTTDAAWSVSGNRYVAYENALQGDGFLPFLSRTGVYYDTFSMHYDNSTDARAISVPIQLPAPIADEAKRAAAFNGCYNFQFGFHYWGDVDPGYDVELSVDCSSLISPDAQNEEHWFECVESNVWSYPGNDPFALTGWWDLVAGSSFQICAPETTHIRLRFQAEEEDAQGEPHEGLYIDQFWLLLEGADSWLCNYGREDDTFVCDDGLDNDGDNHTDAEDPDCWCLDGICCLADVLPGDNGGDGLPDCNYDADSDGGAPGDEPCQVFEPCADAGSDGWDPAQSPLDNCTDGVDNDNDCLPDCADPDCQMLSDESWQENTVVACSDGLDNDCDSYTDCNDADCAGLVECNCIDWLDNDNDGFSDCADTDCYPDPLVGAVDYITIGDPSIPIPVCQDSEGMCNDYRDNDGDGYTDCGDPDCFERSYCEQDPQGQAKELTCNDLRDNNGDGCTDCRTDGQFCSGEPDPDCPCTDPENICNDRIDNDGDGWTDCQDTPDCSESCLTDIESDGCADGYDNDGDFLTDCEDTCDCCEDGSCNGHSSCTEEDCNNGADEDCDGFVDCQDVDCLDRLIWPCGPEDNECACNDGIDNDGNALTDSNDWGCGEAPTGLDVYVLHSGNDDNVTLISDALGDAGHTVHVGRPWYQQDGAQSLSSYDVVVFLDSFNWNASNDPMPEAGENEILQFVEGGGGLVTCEWFVWSLGDDLENMSPPDRPEYYFVELAPLSPVVPTDEYRPHPGTPLDSVTYTRLTVDPILSSGVAHAFEFDLDYELGSETYFEPRAGATVYYLSEYIHPDYGTTGAGVVGWTYTLPDGSTGGRVISISTIAGNIEMNTPSYKRLFINMVEWAGYKGP